MSKATWGIVDLVLDLGLTLGWVVHGGYCDDPCHPYHHHHHHPHHPLRQPWPTSRRSPNKVGFESTVTINEDSPDAGYAPPRSTGCETLDSPCPQGTRPQKRWGRAAVPHMRSCHRPPFDQRLGQSSLGPPYPKFLGWCRGTLDWWWSYRPRPGTPYPMLAEDVGIPCRPCSVFRRAVQRVSIYRRF